MEINDDLLDKIYSIQETTSLSKVEADETSAQPSHLFIESLKKDRAKKNGRALLFWFTVALITAIGICAYQGGKFIASWASGLTVFFMILDWTISYLFYKRLVTGVFKIVCLVIDLASFIYFGIAISALYGSGNAQVVARNYLAADYDAVQSHYSDAATIRNLLADAVSNAAVVAAQENEHGGHGVVFSQAEAINQIKLKDLPAKPSIVTEAPEFESLSEANTWLQTQEQEATRLAAGYDSYYNTIRESSQRVDSAINRALLTPLTEFQKSSLNRLESSIAGISGKPKPKSVTFNHRVAREDLRAEDYTGYIGFLVELIVLFFIGLLAYLPDTRESLEDMQDREVRIQVRNALKGSRIRYDAAKLKAIDQDKLLFFLQDLVDSPKLIDYMKSKKATFDMLFEFSEKHSELLYYLQKNDCMWSLFDINKELNNDPDFADSFEEAVAVPRSTWKKRTV